MCVLDGVGGGYLVSRWGVFRCQGGGGRRGYQN